MKRLFTTTAILLTVVTGPAAAQSREQRQMMADIRMLQEQAQQLQDGHWQSLYNEVVVLAFDLKDMPKAQQVLARLRQLQPDNPEVAKLADEVARRGGSASPSGGSA